MGELAALVTSFLWSITSIQFTLAGRRIGSYAVNRIRLLLAVIFLSLAHLLLYGQVLPFDAGLARWGWLGVSGVVGLVLGDGALFQAFVLIGPRRSMLLMTSVPVISTLLAWVWLGEALRPAQVGAILVTVAGIAWVVSERRSQQAAVCCDAKQYALGVLLGLGGALGQALGLVLSRRGLEGDFSALSAALMRMLVAALVLWPLALVRRQVGPLDRVLKDRTAMTLLLGATLMGPVVGMSLSMLAVQRAQVGIASTLMALSPIILIPLEWWLFKERVSARAVVGTVVALIGAMAIFLA
ncbi:MAG: DMT family transporter [Anaerolineae bacterium]|nr:DMT family transporter [Anaerolineae bacterium]